MICSSSFEKITYIKFCTKVPTLQNGVNRILNWISMENFGFFRKKKFEFSADLRREKKSISIIDL